jgi:3-dehydroquinate dehydratase / shikimate dehydrogenase
MPSLPKSLPHICVALGFPSAAQLARAAEREYKDGNTFLEFRLDYLPDPAAGIEVIRKLCKSLPDTHILATCRHKRASGHYKGDIEQQFAILQSAAAAGAALLDLEIESAEMAKPAVAALGEAAPLCLSYHNFENTPALEPVLRRLERFPASA